jgi:hypothetical protein
MNKNPYARHRFPAEIISHSPKGRREAIVEPSRFAYVWLYNSFSLSLCDIEKIVLYRQE